MQTKRKLRQSIGILLSLAAVLANYSPQTQAVRALPETLRVRAGETYAVSVGWPYSLEPSDVGAQVLSSSDESVGVIGAQAGQTHLTVSLLGVPVKQVTVQVDSEKILYPGGQSIGAALNTQGVLVVGLSEVDAERSASPGREAGLRAGDLLLSINGQSVLSAAQLTEMLAAQGASPLQVRYARRGEERETTVQAAQDALDGQWRLGLWVRDSTAGVGTLSFYDPQTQRYGALGHAITDLDTGVTLPVREGSILRSSVVGIRRGERGTPGELQGSFLRNPVTLGDIRLNNTFGIYGSAASPIVNPLYPQGLPVGSQASVHTGPASILTTLDDGGVREYGVEITRVTRQEEASPKSLTIRVTDPELLERTGGIVQGMSGSPILQDGRIVGAVTHVFVSDPTQGYGVFIEWMMQQANSL